MRPLLIKPALRLRGKVALLGDKSIAHRSIIVSAITSGKTKITNFPNNKDCIYTLKAFRRLGIKIILNPRLSTVTVFGKGLLGLNKPPSPIYVGDSGTTLRLILGVLAGQNFSVKLLCGKSLVRRPMLRVTKPLRMMGAKIDARHPASGIRDEEYPPIAIKGGSLKPINYKTPVASAQVKSAILLAGLYAKGKTRVVERLKTRDHTERILKLFRAGIQLKQNNIIISGNKELVSPKRIHIPGDISSASFFIVLATILPNSRLILKNLSLNPSRTGMIKVLKRMGANIRVRSQASGVTRFESAGDLLIKSSKLNGTRVKKEEIPFLIDELPILMVAACYAQGKTVFEGVGELRVKETDRISSMSSNLNKMGAKIEVTKGVKSEYIIIQGARKLTGCHLKSFGDHRTAMSTVVAGLAAYGRSRIDDIGCISKSFPDFLNILRVLVR
jgi:3-phosphoshikimate 1-carboxyvinyltransferase